MVEDYVSYNFALALKAAGFDEPCRHYYDIEDAPDGCYWEGGSIHKKNHNEDIPKFSAPSLWHAQKWLREKKGIVVIAEPDWDSEDYCMDDYLTGEWYFSVWKDGDRVHCNFDPNAEEERIWMFEKYEQALSAGISAALELIKKGE